MLAGECKSKANVFEPLRLAKLQGAKYWPLQPQTVAIFSIHPFTHSKKEILQVQTLSLYDNVELTNFLFNINISEKKWYSGNRPLLGDKILYIEIQVPFELS